MTFGSLFSGIGGMDLGLERAGMRCVWQSEIDPYACRVLVKHWPGVPNLGDISRIDWSGVERPDLVCGGFPCQDISFAGKGAGLDGKRSGLWYEFARCVREVRPRFVLVENVAALLVRGLDAVLGTLASLGFDAEWEGLPAAAFGADHIRDRLFILAYSAGFRGGVFDYPPYRRGSPFWPPCDFWGQDRQEGIGPLERRRDDSLRRAGQCGVLPVADGIPSQLDVARMRGYGNAVVPQVAEFIGRRLMEDMA